MAPNDATAKASEGYNLDLPHLPNLPSLKKFM
jgi:hypothetical protein